MSGEMTARARLDRWRRQEEELRALRSADELFVRVSRETLRQAWWNLRPFLREDLSEQHPLPVATYAIPTPEELEEARQKWLDEFLSLIEELGCGP